MYFKMNILLQKVRKLSDSSFFSRKVNAISPITVRQSGSLEIGIVQWNCAINVLYQTAPNSRTAVFLTHWNVACTRPQSYAADEIYLYYLNPLTARMFTVFGHVYYRTECYTKSMGRSAPRYPSQYPGP